MTLILASSNVGKQRELRRILAGHTLLLPQDLSLSYSCKETGNTYLANALLKAETLYALAARPVLADDSGLSVEALGGAPGIYSARYRGETPENVREEPPPLSSRERNDLLLSAMENQEDRRAFFVCCLVLKLSPHRLIVVQETLEGTLARRASGQEGFGYDPLLFLKEYGKTVAELTPALKDRLSHRGKAAARIAHWLSLEDNAS